MFQGPECFGASPYHPARYAHDRGISWNGMDHDRAGADPDVIAETDIPEHRSSRADHDTIAQGWVPLAALVTSAADRNSLIKQDIIPDFGCLADYDSQTVVDEQPFADCGSRMNLNSCDETGKTRHDPCCDEQLPAVKKVGYAMEK